MHHRQLPIPTELWLCILDHVLDIDYPRTTARILGALEASCRALSELVRWMQTIYNVRNHDNIPIIFAINKMDESEHLVTKDEIREVLFRYPFVNYEIIETSAKTRENIEQLFTETVRAVRRGCNLDMPKLIRFILKNDKKVLQKVKKPCHVM